MALSDATASVAGVDDMGALGEGVSDGADFDGDGLADLLVGYPEGRGAEPYSGLALLYLGPVSGTHDLLDADLRLDGDETGLEAGYALTSAGDTDLDGRDELLIGAPMNTTERAYLVNAVEGI
jgi:hypothetical protein